MFMGGFPSAVIAERKCVMRSATMRNRCRWNAVKMSAEVSLSVEQVRKRGRGGRCGDADYLAPTAVKFIRQ
ncbi:unnamed protein product, partial [Iphiclides podalirius]